QCELRELDTTRNLAIMSSDDSINPPSYPAYDEEKVTDVAPVPGPTYVPPACPVPVPPAGPLPVPSAGPAPVPPSKRRKVIYWKVMYSFGEIIALSFNAALYSYVNGLIADPLADAIVGDLITL